jgi:adenylylsulfate kinase
MKKILIMGLPGAGKTWLAERLQQHLQCAWYNADAIRKMANDWDFSPEGRTRQSLRMRAVADYEKSHNRIVICDFVCPTHETQKLFEPDITIWVDTITQGRFEDTNKLFQAPKNVDIHITRYLSDEEIEQLGEKLNHGLKEKIII